MKAAQLCFDFAAYHDLCLRPVLAVGHHARLLHKARHGLPVAVEGVPLGGGDGAIEHLQGPFPVAPPRVARREP